MRYCNTDNGDTIPDGLYWFFGYWRNGVWRKTKEPALLKVLDQHLILKTENEFAYAIIGIMKEIEKFDIEFLDNELKKHPQPCTHKAGL